ncbi:hypothetical protein [Nonomuraea sp. NPDC050643]|uniref:hypothetical protein n=1 Tax=Nonomuraea sp. NPDC050643 TaxID=3155660 RepID=UPI0033E81505
MNERDQAGAVCGAPAGWDRLGQVSPAAPGQDRREHLGGRGAEAERIVASGEHRGARAAPGAIA